MVLKNFLVSVFAVFMRIIDTIVKSTVVSAIIDAQPTGYDSFST